MHFGENNWVDFNVIWRVSGNSDGSGDLGEGFELEGCIYHAKIWSGDRFLNILGCDSLRDDFLLLVNDVLKTNYSTRLRQPYDDLLHRVYPKHHNLISKCSKFRKHVKFQMILFFVYWTQF